MLAEQVQGVTTEMWEQSYFRMFRISFSYWTLNDQSKTFHTGKISIHRQNQFQVMYLLRAR